MAKDVKRKQNAALISAALKGDVSSIGRLLTEVERDLRGFLPRLKSLKSKSKALRVGITGPPGAGKSTLVNCLVHDFRKSGHRVAVLAVDPSSPFSGGALLGDRVRMGDHSADKDVFIRSIGSRGGLGGLSGATGVMAKVLEACGYGVIIIETVGVGQTELQIMNLADATAVVLVPESGDVIQTLKAGILEIADVFVINKSDRPGAELLAHELKGLVEQEGERPRDIFLTCATQEKGVKEFAAKLLRKARELSVDKSRLQARAKGELRSLLLAQYDQKLASKLDKLKITDVYASLLKFKS